MTKNPYLNALTAILYIIGVASVMFYAGNSAPGPDTVIAPIALVSLLTLSVAVMAYLFFYQPLQLFIEGKKKVALDLFAKTVAVFASITVVIFAIFFSGVLS